MTSKEYSVVEERDALYYPYIHIRDTNWLKRTLLVFPHVVRMLPRFEFVPNDTDDFVIKLRETKTKNGEPLLRPALLGTENVSLAQQGLIRNFKTDLERDREAFIELYGEVAAKKLKHGRRDKGFQVHKNKACDDLICLLRKNNLAWTPASGDKSYVELHPRIGQAVMSTIAVGCAQDEGFDIVTDPSDKDSRQLNLCLATRGSSEVYNTWVHPRKQSSPAKQPGENAILELIVYNRCDPSKLTPECLAQLADDREALAKLKSQLRSMAASIPAMMNDTKLHERLTEKADAALEEWKKDKVNLSNVAREIFGEGCEGVGDLMTKLAEKVVDPGVWKTAALPGGFASLMLNPFLGIIGGFAVGVIVTSLHKVQQKAKESPYRYLTILERAGVAFTLGT